MAVMLLQQEAGVREKLRVVPLFETLDGAPHGLQLQSLWRIPTAAVGHRQVTACSCDPYGESLLQL